MEAGKLTSLQHLEQGFSCTCKELHDMVDAGWRRFWKKRGFDSPPELYAEDNWFGRKLNEKKSAKEDKQKEAERTKGIQKAGREFSRKQGLRKVRKKA